MSTIKEALNEALDEIQKNLTEIERLRGLVKYHCQAQMEGWKRERELKSEITLLKEQVQELKDTVNLRDSWVEELDKKERAREANKDE